ncbi:hypothetical protein [Peristeroidobacter soli]|uniref:hypothetical protein n=1 Tax=Peristeroidobacter soli TaxID=2497877 RepID=UPI00130094DC|nr:hypothetical protein [Peristeroidobacter soli]
MSAIIDATTVQPAQRYYELGLSLFHTSALAATSFADEHLERALRATPMGRRNWNF